MKDITLQPRAFLLIVVNMFLAILAPLFTPLEIGHFVWLIFLVQFASFFWFVIGMKDFMFFMLSPSFLCITYFSVNAFFGSLAYNHDIVDPKAGFIGFFSFRHTQWSVLYYLLANCAALFAAVLAMKRHLRFDAINGYMPKPQNRMVILIIFSAIFGLFSVFDLDLSFLGGNGSFSLMPMTLAALGLFIWAYLYVPKWRYLIYSIVVALTTITHFSSKRETLSFILSIFAIEVILADKFMINFKRVAVGVCFFALFMYFVLIMSILRGYGGYVDRMGSSPSVVVGSVGDYVTSDNFLSSFLTNLEFDAFYYNSFKSTDFLLEDSNLLGYGSTILKVLYIPLPSEIFGKKPETMIDRYTKLQNPDFFKKGGSFPINFYSEMLWNFHFFGLFFVFAIFLIIDSLFFKEIAVVKRGTIPLSAIFFLFCYQYFFIYFRGSGMDLYVVYILIAGLSFYFFKTLLGAFGVNNFATVCFPQK